MNDRLKFRAYFEETISDSDGNDYSFKFYLSDIAIYDSDIIGIDTEDFKEQIKQAFGKFKEKNPKLTEDDLQHIIEDFYEDNSCDNEDWLNITRFSSIVQSTGLKDKNGKLIFGGDIIIGENYLFPCYDNRKIAIGWDKEVGGFKMNAFNMKDIEVIGNIHENPELLGGK